VKAWAPGPGITVTGTAQHEAWFAREVPPVEQLADGLWSIPVPMPERSPLRYVSVYVFAVPGGLVLIDAGWGDDGGWAALTGGLAGIGASVDDVRGVLVTHMHWDHLGLADRIRQASGAWVALHEDDLALITQASYRDADLAVARDHERLVQLGASPEEAGRVGTNPEFWQRFISAPPPDRVLRDGDLADAPGWDLRVVHTPGHTPGHVCFASEQLDTLFSGDHILPRITPNISTEVGGPDDPLGQYLESLHSASRLPLTHVAPAHEWRFDGLAARAAEIAAHHDRRLAEVVAAVRAHPDTTPWEIAGELTWSRSWDQYDGRMRVFAVTETMAHVARLAATGDLVSDGGAVPRYRVPDRA
jgi:glyoxylase-like metal-dependent hydrolase (beta-lactamase superfamily II)